MNAGHDVDQPSSRAPASLREAAVHGVLWTLTESWLVRLFGLVVLALLGRLLGPEEFGTVAVAAIAVDFVAIFVGTGFGAYLVQSESVDDTDINTAFWVSALVGIVLSAGVVTAAPIIAGALGSPEIAPMIRWLALGLVLGALVGVPTALLQRQLKFRALALRSIVAAVSSGTVAVALAVAGAGAWSLVAQTLLYGVVSTATVWIGARWVPRLVFSRSRARRMGAFAANLVGVQLLSFARVRGEFILIAVVLGPIPLGVWVVGKRVVSVVLELFQQVVTRVAMPVFSRAKADRERLTRGYSTACVLSVAITAPVLCQFAAASSYLVPAVFGDQWHLAATLSAILALGMLPMTASAMDRGLLLALDRSGLVLRLSAMMALTQLGVAAAALWMGAGLVGLAIALAAKNFVTWPLRFFVVMKATGLDLWKLLGALARVWCAALLAGAAAWASLHVGQSVGPAWLGLLGAVVVGTSIYAAALWLVHREVFRELVASGGNVVRRLRPGRSRQATASTVRGGEGHVNRSTPG